MDIESAVDLFRAKLSGFRSKLDIVPQALAIGVAPLHVDDDLPESIASLRVSPDRLEWELDALDLGLFGAAIVTQLHRALQTEEIIQDLGDDPDDWLVDYLNGQWLPVLAALFSLAKLPAPKE